MTDPMTPPSDGDPLRGDFETMRRNSARRSPTTIPELIEFLSSARIFARAIVRYRPVDAGQCKL